MGTQRLRPCRDAFTDVAGGGRRGGDTRITPGALVIVHLSHMNRYASECGERAAQGLASRLVHAIHGMQGQCGVKALRGAIVITDPQYPLGSTSAARLRS